MNASIRTIDKEIAECETFLNKVLKRNIKKPRRVYENKRKTNSTGDRHVEPFLTSPTASKQFQNPLTYRLSRNKPDERSPCRSKSPVRRELLLSSPTAMSNRNNSHRRRAHSSGQVLTSPRTDDGRSNLKDLMKQTKLLFEPLRFSKPRDGSCGRTSRHASWEHSSRPKSSPRTRYVTWDEATKENITKGRKSEISKGSNHRNSHHRKATKSVASTKPTIRSTSVHKNKHHRHDVTSEDSVTSDNSSSFNRVAAVETLKKRNNISVRKDNPKNVSSTSSKVDSEYDNKKSFGDSAAKLDSTESKQTLLKELKDLSSNQHPETTLQRVIVDLEQALKQIPAGSRSPDLYSVSDISNEFVSAVLPGTDSYPALQRVIDSCIVKPLVVDTKVDKCTSTTHLSETDEALSTTFTKKHVQDSCDLLEQNCERMHVMCHELKLERDHLKLDIEMKAQKLRCMENYLENNTVEMNLLRKELEKRNANIEEMLTKDKNDIELIIELRSEKENLSGTLSKLRSEVAQLHEENRVLPLLRDTQAKRCRSVERLRSKLWESEKNCQLLKLEREKLQVMNVAKDNELERLKKEISEISSLGSYNVSHLKNNAKLEKLKLIGNGSHFDTLALEVFKLLEPKLSNWSNRSSNHSSSFDTIPTVPNSSTKTKSVSGMSRNASPIMEFLSKEVTVQDKQQTIEDDKSHKESKNSVKACVDSLDSLTLNHDLTVSDLMTALFHWMPDSSSTSSHESDTREEKTPETYEDAKSTTTLGPNSSYYKNMSEIVETGSMSVCSGLSSLNFSVSDIEGPSVRK